MRSSSILPKQIAALLLASSLVSVQGCTSSPTVDDLQNEVIDDTRPPPHESNVPCSTYKITTIDELLESKSSNFAYGTVRSIDPVLDRFQLSEALDQVVDSCDDRILPALILTLELADASWEHKASDVLTIGIHGLSLDASRYRPSINQAGELAWKHAPEFLVPGAQIGVIGSFVNDDWFFMPADQHFVADDKGTITTDVGDDKCFEDNLVGRNVSELIERVRQLNESRRIAYEDPATEKLASVCEKIYTP